jgi:23S rRNA-/tRNA-specific pseudouridylate synthase
MPAGQEMYLEGPKQRVASKFYRPFSWMSMTAMNSFPNKQEDDDESPRRDGGNDTSRDLQSPTSKRGMKKQNSKRNRKQPRSDENQQPPVVETRICKLELEEDSIQTSTGCSWLRVVEPYPYSFSTYAKARWIGRTILDVYHTEFGSYPKSYYASAIHQGRILVSDQKVNDTYLIQRGDLLSHTVHRHEPGIAVYSNQPPFVRVVEETAEVLVIDKPGTLPIHPCGGYHLQSLVNLLQQQYGKLYTIHRLDRLTSGLVILGKTAPVAQEWGKCIMERECQKVYLARVMGKFPMNCPPTLAPLVHPTSDNGAPLLPINGEWNSMESTKNTGEDAAQVLRQRHAVGYWITDMKGCVQRDISLSQLFDASCSVETWLEQLDPTSSSNCTHDTASASTSTTTKNSNDAMHWFHLACPTRVAQHKDGICEAGAFVDLDETTYVKTVKSAQTSFGVVQYDPDTDSTVIMCRPATGRTHQIRLHLQALGHPIANDPNYGGSLWFGNPGGHRASERAKEILNSLNTSNEQEINRLTHGQEAVGHEQHGSPTTCDSVEKPTLFQALDVPATEAEIQDGISQAVRQESEPVHEFIKRTCVWCARSRQTVSEGGREEDRTSLEFLTRSPGIWLHALQYSFGLEGKTMVFRSALPSWAILSP